MPGFDRTGPMGEGSRTGRQSGKCNPENRRNNDGMAEEQPRRGFFGLRIRNGQDSGNSGAGANRGRGQGNGRGKGRGMRSGRNNGF